MTDHDTGRKKHVFFSILLGLALCCFAAYFVFTSHLLGNKSPSITPLIESWESRYLEYNGEWRIDDRIYREHGLSEEDNVEIIYGPFIPLGKGSYYAVVDYEASSLQSIRIYSFENEDKLICKEETLLPEEKHRVCYRFDVTQDIDNFEIRVCYSGDGILAIDNISVYDRQWGIKYHITNLISVFGFIFLTFSIISFKPEIFRVSAERSLWLDAVKGIGIFLVLLGHCKGSPLNWFIYGFHMPLFFIISGYLFKKESIPAYGVKLIKRYIVPYLLFSTANAALRIPYMLTGDYTVSGIINRLGAYIMGAIRGEWREMPNCMPLWFFPALAVSLLLFRLIMIIPNKPVRVVIILICALVGYFFNDLADDVGIPTELPWGQHTVFTDIAFISIGFCLRDIHKKYGSIYESMVSSKQNIMIASLSIPGVMCIITNHLYFHDVDIYYNSYGNIILTYLGAVAVSLALMLFVIRRDGLKGSDPIVIIGFNSAFFFAFDFWGRTLALNFPRVSDHEFWPVTFILKLIFVGLLFVIIKSLKRMGEGIIHK